MGHHYSNDCVLAMEMSDMGMALLVGRYEMERTCLKEDVANKFQEFTKDATCDGGADKVAAAWLSKYTLVHPKQISVCGISAPGTVTKFQSEYFKANCVYRPQSCRDPASVSFTVKTENDSRILYAVMDNSTEAVRRLLETQKNPHCKDKHNVC